MTCDYRLITKIAGQSQIVPKMFPVLRSLGIQTKYLKLSIYNLYKKTLSDLIATYRAVKDPENRARILQREKQKLERARKMGKTKVIVMVRLS